MPADRQGAWGRNPVAKHARVNRPQVIPGKRAERDIDNEDRDYMAALARYRRGCPAMAHEDICSDPAECAADGRCRLLQQGGPE